MTSMFVVVWLVGGNDRSYTDAMTASALTQALRAFFEADAHGASAVYLFGSTARGAAGAGSDVDIGLLFKTPPASTLEGQPFDVADALERLLGRAVDVVVLNSAPADVRIRVLRDGVLVFEGDPVSRIRFEVATRNEAFDLEPILQEYRRPRSSA
jgi:predicted nucleotidyltransferase